MSLCRWIAECQSAETAGDSRQEGGTTCVLSSIILWRGGHQLLAVLLSPLQNYRRTSRCFWTDSTTGKSTNVLDHLFDTYLNLHVWNDGDFLAACGIMLMRDRIFITEMPIT